jgi:hypothetical protein
MNVTGDVNVTAVNNGQYGAIIGGGATTDGSKDAGSGGTVLIDTTGSIIATAGNPAADTSGGGAAIGGASILSADGGYSGNGPNLTVKSGTLVLTPLASEVPVVTSEGICQFTGAGIGSGGARTDMNNYNMGNPGNIKIEGGTVFVKGGMAINGSKPAAAAIGYGGGSANALNIKPGGSIAISGGTVVATASVGGMAFATANAIGNNSQTDQTQAQLPITITGGNVYAVSNNHGNIAYNSISPEPVGAEGSPVYPVYIPNSLNNGSGSVATAGTTFTINGISATTTNLISNGDMAGHAFAALSGYGAVVWTPASNAKPVMATGSFTDTIGLVANATNTYAPSGTTNIVRYEAPATVSGFAWSPAANASITSNNTLVATGDILLTTDDATNNQLSKLNGHAFWPNGDGITITIVKNKGQTYPNGVKCANIAYGYSTSFKTTLTLRNGAVGEFYSVAPYAAMEVRENADLTICGAGTIIAKAGDAAQTGDATSWPGPGAGIGGDFRVTQTGPITITGDVTVHATGGSNSANGSGAGIGSGTADYSDPGTARLQSVCTSINILGNANVFATAGIARYPGAAIGSGAGGSSVTGAYASGSGYSGDITINTTGTVVATNNPSGVTGYGGSSTAIGSGACPGGDGIPTDIWNVGNIDIQNGTVIAKAVNNNIVTGLGGAVIGAGGVYNNPTMTGTNGTITISGGTVLAVANMGPNDVGEDIGIGSLRKGTALPVVITGGNVYTYGRQNGADAGIYGSPSIASDATDGQGHAVHPVYVPYAITGTTGTLAIDSYSAPLCALDSATLGGLLTGTAALGSPVTTDPIAAVAWLTGSDDTSNGTYAYGSAPLLVQGTRYDNITPTITPGQDAMAWAKPTDVSYANAAASGQNVVLAWPSVDELADPAGIIVGHAISPTVPDIGLNGTVLDTANTGWQVKKATDNAWLDFDPSSTLDMSYNGAALRYVAAATSSAVTYSNSATITITGKGEQAPVTYTVQSPNTSLPTTYGQTATVIVSGGTGAGAYSMSIAEGNDYASVIPVTSTDRTDDFIVSVTKGGGSYKLSATRAEDDNYNSRTDTDATATTTVAGTQSALGISGIPDGCAAPYLSSFSVTPIGGNGTGAYGVSVVDTGGNAFADDSAPATVAEGAGGAWTVTMQTGTGSFRLKVTRAGTDGYYTDATPYISDVIVATKIDQPDNTPLTYTTSLEGNALPTAYGATADITPSGGSAGNGAAAPLGNATYGVAVPVQYADTVSVAKKAGSTNTWTVTVLKADSSYRLNITNTGDGAYNARTDMLPASEVSTTKATCDPSALSLSIAGWTYGAYNATANAPSYSLSFNPEATQADVSVGYFGRAYTYGDSEDAPTGAPYGSETSPESTPPAHAGTYSVVVSVAATQDYGALKATYGFTVSPAVLSLDWSNITFDKVYDATDAATPVIHDTAAATYTETWPALSGFVADDSSVDVLLSHEGVTYAFSDSVSGAGDAKDVADGKDVKQTGGTYALLGAASGDYALDAAAQLPEGDIVPAKPSWEGVSAPAALSITYGETLLDATPSSWAYDAVSHTGGFTLSGVSTGALVHEDVTGSLAFTLPSSMPDIVGATGSVAPTDSRYEATFTPVSGNYAPVTCMVYVGVEKAAPDVAIPGGLPEGSNIGTYDATTGGVQAGTTLAECTLSGGVPTYIRMGTTTTIAGIWSWEGDNAALTETFTTGGWYTRPATFTPVDTSRFDTWSTDDTTSVSGPAANKPTDNSAPAFFVASPATLITNAPTVTGSVPYGYTLQQATATGYLTLPASTTSSPADISLGLGGAIELGRADRPLSGTWSWTDSSQVMNPDMGQSATMDSVSVTFTPAPATQYGLTYHTCTVNVSISVKADAPDVPVGIATQAQNASVTASWTAPTYTGGVPLAGYDIEVATDAAFPQGSVVASITALAGATTATIGAIGDATLLNDSTYYVRIRSVNSGTDRDASTTADNVESDWEYVPDALTPHKDIPYTHWAHGASLTYGQVLGDISLEDASTYYATSGPSATVSSDNTRVLGTFAWIAGSTTIPAVTSPPADYYLTFIPAPQGTDGATFDYSDYYETVAGASMPVSVMVSPAAITSIDAVSPSAIDAGCAAKDASEAGITQGYGKADIESTLQSAYPALSASWTSAHDGTTHALGISGISWECTSWPEGANGGAGGYDTSTAGTYVFSPSSSIYATVAAMANYALATSVVLPTISVTIGEAPTWGVSTSRGEQSTYYHEDVTYGYTLAPVSCVSDLTNTGNQYTGTLDAIVTQQDGSPYTQDAPFTASIDASAEVGIGAGATAEGALSVRPAFGLSAGTYVSKVTVSGMRPDVIAGDSEDENTAFSTSFYVSMTVKPATCALDAITLCEPATGAAYDTTYTQADIAGATTYTAGAVTYRADGATGNMALGDLFEGSAVYTAALTLTAADNYAFPAQDAIGASPIQINGHDAVLVSYSARFITLAYTFERTVPKAVASMALVAPCALVYVAGDAFSTSGILVDITYSDGTHDYSQDTDGLRVRDIGVMPAEGTVLYGSSAGTHVMVNAPSGATLDIGELSVNVDTDDIVDALLNTDEALVGVVDRDPGIESPSSLISYDDSRAENYIGYNAADDAQGTWAVLVSASARAHALIDGDEYMHTSQTDIDAVALALTSALAALSTQDHPVLDASYGDAPDTDGALDIYGTGRNTTIRFKGDFYSLAQDDMLLIDGVACAIEPAATQDTPETPDNVWAGNAPGVTSWNIVGANGSIIGTITKGSTIVTLYPALTDAWANGTEHTVVASYDDSVSKGTATELIDVKRPAQDTPGEGAPLTGDKTALVALGVAAVAFAGAIAVFAIAIYRKKKRK